MYSLLHRCKLSVRLKLQNYDDLFDKNVTTRYQFWPEFTGWLPISSHIVDKVWQVLDESLKMQEDAGDKISESTALGD